jgi:hypothetical protein
MNDRKLRRRGLASPLFVDPWSMIRKKRGTGFSKRSCSIKKLERGRDSIQSERALASLSLKA